VPVVPASPVDVTFHPAEVSVALAFAASPVVVVPFRTTTLVVPWSAGVPAAGASGADEVGDDEGSDVADADDDADGEVEPVKE
jgi:hypothetical protein